MTRTANRPPPPPGSSHGDAADPSVRLQAITLALVLTCFAVLAGSNLSPSPTLALALEQTQLVAKIARSWQSNAVYRTLGRLAASHTFNKDFLDFVNPRSKDRWLFTTIGERPLSILFPAQPAHFDPQRLSAFRLPNGQIVQLAPRMTIRTLRDVQEAWDEMARITEVVWPDVPESSHAFIYRDAAKFGMLTAVAPAALEHVLQSRQPSEVVCTSWGFHEVGPHVQSPEWHPKERYAVSCRIIGGNLDNSTFIVPVAVTTTAIALQHEVMRDLGITATMPSGTFAQSFPELAKITSTLDSLDIEQALRFVIGEFETARTTIKILDVDISSVAIGLWGSLVILCVYAYLLAHVLESMSLGTAAMRGWIVCHRTWLSRAIGLPAVSLLPVCTVAVGTWSVTARGRPLQSAGMGLVVAATVVIATVLVWTTLRNCWRIRAYVCWRSIKFAVLEDAERAPGDE